MQEKISSVAADQAAIQNALKGGSSGKTNGSGGDGAGSMFAIAAVVGGGAFFVYGNGSSQTPSQATNTPTSYRKTTR